MVQSPLERGLWPLALSLACSFNGTGFGDPPADSADDAGSSSGAGSSSSGAASTSGTTAVAPTSTADPSTSSDLSTSTAPLTSTDPSTSSDLSTSTSDLSTSTDDSTSTSTGPDDTTGPASTTGPVPCQDVPYKQIVKVDAATTVAPMIKAESGQGEGTVAFSEVAEQGTVSFPVDIPCDAQFAVWGRVLDGEAGTNNYDPDSFHVRADGDPELQWFYGCQSQTSGYRWYRVRSGVQNTPCDTNVPWVLPLASGPHTITLRNREGKDNSGNVAAISRLLITSDLAYVPGPGD